MKREYRTVDKTGWGQGAWHSEPDKMQWKDEATGLDCLIVRGPVGALCGYVGVPPSHPLYEKTYMDNSVDVRVHGGLTFSDSCHTTTMESWEAMRKRLNSPEHAEECAQCPVGDAAEREKLLRPLADDFAAYVAHREATGICHIPEPGDPDHVWWFGFDCAHSGDLCPKMKQYGLGRDGYDVYRSIGYVKGEIARLARQLSGEEETS